MSYLLKTTLSFVIVLFGAVTLSFFLIHMIPGDPVEIMLGDYAAPIDRQALENELGLNKPLIQQYTSYLISTIQLDFERSLMSKKLVSQELSNTFPRSALLGLSSMALALLLGIPLGVLSALKKNRLFDKLTSFTSLLGFSLPTFCLAPLLIWLFSIQLDLLPVGDYGGLPHLILPTLTLTTGLLALLIRMTRTSVLDVVSENYIQVAKAKGLGPFRIYFSHALKNAAFPILTISGLMLGSLITGTIIVEVIFDWPGIGLLLYKAILNRDYTLVQACVLLISFVYIFVNYFTDLLYVYLNPKLADEPL